MKLLPYALFLAALTVPAAAREVRFDKFDDTHPRLVTVERTPFACSAGDPAAFTVGALAVGLLLLPRRPRD